MIGFIGIGIMGEPMSENLMKKSGQAIMVYDLNKDAVATAVEAGAVAAASLQEVAQSCSVVFTMLPKDEHVRSVYDQLLPHLCAGQVLVEMSTISPETSRALATQAGEKGAVLLDAPVVKSRPAAVAGTLGIYVGGDLEAYRKVLPLLQCMGSNVIHLGDNGAGLVMKLCHNMLVSQIQNGVNEMLFAARKLANIPVEVFAEAVTYGGAHTFYLESKKDALKNRDFTTAFSAAYMHKDVGLAKELFDQAGLELEGAQLAVERYRQVMEKGWGAEDFSCTYRLFDGEE